jgi:hypothetical protein
MKRDSAALRKSAGLRKACAVMKGGATGNEQSEMLMRRRPEMRSGNAEYRDDRRGVRRAGYAHLLLMAHAARLTPYSEYSSARSASSTSAICGNLSMLGDVLPVSQLRIDG